VVRLGQLPVVCCPWRHEHGAEKLRWPATTPRTKPVFTCYCGPGAEKHWHVGYSTRGGKYGKPPARKQ
jgi:hypothetical protein